MTEPSTPTGPRLWLLIALPLLVQFGVLALGASVLRALTSEPREDTTLTNLPQSILILFAYAVFAAAIWLVAKRLGAPPLILALRRVPLRQGLLLGGGDGVLIAGGGNHLDAGKAAEYLLMAAKSDRVVWRRGNALHD